MGLIWIEKKNGRKVYPPSVGRLWPRYKKLGEWLCRIIVCV